MNGKVLAMVIGIATLTVSQSALAVAIPSGCTGAGKADTFKIFTDAGTTTLGGAVVMGQQLWFQVSIRNDCGGGGCSFSGGQINIKTPDGVSHPATPAGGVPLICACPATASPFTECPVGSVDHVDSLLIGPYTVSAADFNNAQAQAQLCNGTALFPQIAASVLYTGATVNCATSCQLTLTDAQCLSVSLPCIDVTKLVACKPAGGDCSQASYCKSATGFTSDDAPQAAFCYSITVTNCGNADLNISVVNDNIFGDLFSDFTNANNGVFMPIGASTTFYFSTLTAVGETNTVTVTGLEQATGNNNPLTAMDSATTTVFHASITCVKEISVNGGPFSSMQKVPPGANPNVTYRVIASNNGSAQLQNVSATDATVPGLNFSGRTLNPGQSTTNTTTVAANDVAHCDVACTNVGPNTVTVSGTVPNNPENCVCGLGPDGQPVGAHHDCSATLQCQCAPGIQVIKLVACKTSGGCPANGDPAYGKNATGVVGSVFCYNISVVNTGAVPLTVTSVSDTVLNLSGCSAFVTPFALQPGQSVNCIIEESYNSPGHVPDTASAVAHDSSNTMVNDSDDASVDVLPVPLECSKVVSASASGPFVPDLDLGALPAGSPPQNVYWQITVHNPNTFDLANVVVSETTALPSGTVCSDGQGLVTFPHTIPTLAAGATVTITCSNQVSCPADIPNSISAQGEVGPNSGVCAIGTDGLPVKSQICTDSAQVHCTQIFNCVTRTPGYWFNHPLGGANCATLLAAIEANGGKLDLGFVCLPTRDQNNDGVTDAKDALSEAESFFPPSGTGSTLCGARKKLAFHLIAALANRALFGTLPGQCPSSTGGLLPATLIEDAQKAGACGDLKAIKQQMALLGQFENSGDNADFPPPLRACGGFGGKNGRTSLLPKVTPFFDCANTANCASGHACP